MKRFGMLFVIMLFLVSPAQSAVIFADDFNRPDGEVGNGWTTWRGWTNDSARINLADGELVTLGDPNSAGGIYRTQIVTFPLQFSFDFRSQSTNLDEQGFCISFNMPASSLIPTVRLPVGGVSQLAFYQLAGTKIMNREYQTPSGSTQNMLSVLPGQRAHSGSVFTTVSGTVNSDLSAVIIVDYHDRLAPVGYAFGPAIDPISSPVGNLLVLSNFWQGAGPRIFDSLVVQSVDRQYGDHHSDRLAALEARVAALESDYSEPDWEATSDVSYFESSRYHGPTSTSIGPFEHDSIKVLAEGDGKISGRVTANGQSRSGIRLRLLLSKNLRTVWTTSDQNGVYTIQVPSGKYLYQGFDLDHQNTNRILTGMIDLKSRSSDDRIIEAQPQVPGYGPDFNFVDAVIPIKRFSEAIPSADVPFEWEPYPNASYYTIQIWHTGTRRHGNFEPLLPYGHLPRVDSTSVTAKELQIPLELGHYYHWMVRAYSQSGEELSYSPTQNFGVATDPPQFSFVPEDSHELAEIITEAPPL